MAIYHLSAKIIGRKDGRSAVAAAAYRAGDRLHDERTGETHDFTRKGGVTGTEIIAPDGAPDWVTDRQLLWSSVEMTERRKDAQLAREVEVAIPRELSDEQGRELVREWVRAEMVSKGMVADIAFHNPDGDHPHAHIMLTLRKPQNEPGKWGKKERAWNDRSMLERWRESWAEHANRALESAGRPERIDHRSLEAQGIERVPQPKLGPAAAAMERKGIRTERGDALRAAAAANAELVRIGAEVKALEEQERALEKEIKEEDNMQMRTVSGHELPQPDPEGDRRRELAQEALELHRRIKVAQSAEKSARKALELRHKAENLRERGPGLSLANLLGFAFMKAVTFGSVDLLARMQAEHAARIEQLEQAAEIEARKCWKAGYEADPDQIAQRRAQLAERGKSLALELRQLGCSSKAEVEAAAMERRGAGADAFRVHEQLQERELAAEDMQRLGPVLEDLAAASPAAAAVIEEELRRMQEEESRQSRSLEESSARSSGPGMER